MPFFIGIPINMRRKDREITNFSEIKNIIENAKILHLGMSGKNIPYVLPLHYGFEIQDDKIFFYIHSAKTGKKMEILQENPNVYIAIESPWELVPGSTPCTYGALYKSFQGLGIATFLKTSEAKIKGLKFLMKHQTDKEFHFDESMVSNVSVIQIEMTSITAKGRLQ